MEYKGNPVSPGIAIGEVYLYTPSTPEIAEKIISPDEAEAAIGRYSDLLKKTEEELIEIKEKLLLGEERDKAGIIEAQINLLHDIAMNAEIKKHILNNFLSPECAIEKTYSKYIRLLSKANDEQIRERIDDLRDIKTRLHRVWFDIPQQNLSTLEKEVVVVANNLFTSDTANIDRSKVLAIVTETGGSNSHSAIIARSYEIPAISGVPNVMAGLKDGEPVIVDALEGVLHTSPDEEAYELYKKKRRQYKAKARETKRYLNEEPVTKDGIRIEVNLNIGSVAPEELAGSQYTDGVGLFRTEFMYMSGFALPTEEKQYLAYRKAAVAFGGRPVIIRILDIGGDKQLGSFELPKEDNPFLGLRALRLCFENMPLLKTQIRAILRAACHGNLWLMLPMVGSLDDIRAAGAMIEEVKKDLEREGAEYKADVPVGIMIEIPSIALVADMAVKEVDFASIGTNDLCQYLMAVDRLNPAVSKYYQSYHPAMFRLIGQVVSAFNDAGKPIGICGEMGGEPLAVAALIGLGIRKFSMGISSVPGVKKLITGLTLPQAKSLAEQALSCATASEVEKAFKEGSGNLIKP